MDFEIFHNFLLKFIVLDGHFYLFLPKAIIKMLRKQIYGLYLVL